MRAKKQKKHEKRFTFFLTSFSVRWYDRIANMKNHSYFSQDKHNIKEEKRNMPIILAPLNKDLTIVRIATDDKTKKHLESLGIFPNGVIMVLSSSGGSVVVKIKDGRIALDSNLSTKIFVA